MPDESLLARWLEDELEAADHEPIERWAAGRADWLAWRDEVRAWKRTLQAALPAAAEPPAVEFFDARIARIVREGAAPAVQAPAPVRRAGWRAGWWMPAAAAAGMVGCFWAGMRVGAPVPAAAPKRPAAITAVYTPEQGVKARVFDDADATALVIVLDGVAAIPDSFEIPDRAATRGSDADERWLSNAGDPR